MAAGKVALLLVHGTNPAHSLPGAFTQALGKVGYKVSFSSYMDETAAAADLILPDLHPLEQWNDSRPRAGIYALQQPAMQPVFPDTRHTGDVLLHVAGRTGTFKDYLQAKWRELHRRFGAGKSFEQFWLEAVQHGGLYGEAPARTVRLAETAARIDPAARTAEGSGDQTVVVFPHPVLHDGRGANKPWLRVARSGRQDCLARVGRSASGDRRALGCRHRRLPAAQVGVRCREGAGVDHGQRAPGRACLAHGAGARGVRPLRQGPLIQRVRAAGAEANGYGGRTFAVRATATKTGEHRKIVTTEGSRASGARDRSRS